MNAAAIALLLAWTLFAFGAVYPWAFLPALLLSLVGALRSTRFSEMRIADTRVVDGALLVVVAILLLQLVPLPPALLGLLSPNEVAYLDRVSLTPVSATAWRHLALDTHRWSVDGGSLIAAICTFWWVRSTLSSRSTRALTRYIAWMGLAVAVVALVQPALATNGRIYGFWQPESQSAHPVGPIVGRSHFAAWVMLAWPLVVGGLIAHARLHWRPTRHGIAQILGDTRAQWLVAAAALLAASLLITESRAGLLGFLLAVGVMVVRTWGRISRSGRIGILVLLGGLVVATSMWASPDAVLNRFDAAYSGVDGGRPWIWRETWELVRDFPLTGIGLGAFEVVMPAYQTTSFIVLINHAHNQYLHLLAEGGALLVAPLSVAVLGFVVVGWRRIRADHSPMVHVRDGALAGLVGLAMFGMVDVPSLTPAVLLLAATSAGLVLSPPVASAPPPKDAD